MSKLRIVCLIMCLLVCLTGCMRMDVGVDIREDGTASVTAKVSIEDEYYEMLVSMENTGAETDTSESDEVSEDDSNELGSDVDLSEFKLETIDGEKYYSYSETVEFESYEELCENLSNIDPTGENSEDSTIFETVHVNNDKNKYSFSATTRVEESSDTADDSADIEMPDDWLVVTLTVKLPGEIVETNGTALDDGSVEFKIDDFSEAQTFTVESEVDNSSGVLSWFLIGGAAVACGVMLYLKKKN